MWKRIPCGCNLGRPMKRRIPERQQRSKRSAGLSGDCVIRGLRAPFQLPKFYFRRNRPRTVCFSAAQHWSWKRKRGLPASPQAVARLGPSVSPVPAAVPPAVRQSDSLFDLSHPVRVLERHRDRMGFVAACGAGLRPLFRPEPGLRGCWFWDVMVTSDVYFSSMPDKKLLTYLLPQIWPANFVFK